VRAHGGKAAIGVPLADDEYPLILEEGDAAIRKVVGTAGLEPQVRFVENVGHKVSHCGSR
jgi:hypothetical protein